MEHTDSQNNTHSNIDQMQKPTLSVSPHNPPTTAGSSPKDGPPWLGDEAVCSGQGVWWYSPHAIWNQSLQTGERTEQLDTLAIKQRVRRRQKACKHKDSPISPEERKQVTL